MERCPSCDFPVQDEWNSCRRCGAHVPIEHNARGLPQRMSARPAVPRPAVTGPPAQTRAVVLTAPTHDTLLPHQAGAAPNAHLPAPKAGDTLLPRLASVRGPATIAALVGAGIAAARLAGRRHRQA